MTERDVALVTGASRGIGRAVALEFAGLGYHLLLNYRSNHEAAEQTLSLVRQAGGEGELCRFDVSQAEETDAAMEALVAAHPTISVLVNNAGVTADGLFAMMPRAEWQRVMDTSLGGFYGVTRPVLNRCMVPRKRGSVVTISSVSGLIGNRGQANYSAAKAGLIAASRALAKEVARIGIRVNVVAPGLIATDMSEQVPARVLKQMIPMARMGRAEEVAKAVRFLCSADASYITGEVLSVHGGMF